jgi:hypothetical protein
MRYTVGIVNRKTANNGITKSKQLKCVFVVQYHIICIKISFKNIKDVIFIKNINFYDSCAIIIVFVNLFQCQCGAQLITLNEIANERGDQ